MAANLDTLICIGVATMSCFIGCLLLSLRADFNVSRFLVLIYYGVAVFALYSILESISSSQLLLLPLFVFCGLLPAFVFLFVRDVFRDVASSKIHIVSLVSFLILLLTVYFFLLLSGNGLAATVGVFLSAVKALLLLGALWILTSNWKNDLINTRIEFRIKLVITSVFFGFFILAFEALQEYVPFHDTTSTHVSVSIRVALLIAVFWSGIKMLTIERSVALVVSGDSRVRDKREDKLSFDAGNAQLLERLLTDEQVFRINGLTVADLASKMGIKEYQLRNLINRTLGHRNFTEFLNEYRLGYVQKQLLESELPILSIALDAGFKSISPFNRAFKAKFGITPSQFRLQSLAPDATNSTSLRIV